MKFNLAFLLLVAMNLLKLDCIANEIDLIKNDSDVISFFKQNFENYKDIKLSFPTPKSEIERLHDSLKTVNWYKVDFDDNGETDILIFNLFPVNKIFAVIADDGTFRKIEASCERQYDALYPVILNINNETLILCHNQNRIEFDVVNKRYLYTNLECDTLIFKNNYFLTYIQNPKQYAIDSIDIENDGQCEGTCPQIFISINCKTYASACDKNVMRNNRNQNYTATLSKEEIQRIVEMLQYSNFSEYNDYYEIPYTDQPTAWITIFYDGGKSKKIELYGYSGPCTLMEIYKYAVNCDWKEKY